MCKKNKKKVKERWLPMILIYKDGSLTRARGQGDITGVDASKLLCFSLDEDGCPHANLDIHHAMKKYPLSSHLGEIVDYWIRHFELMQKGTKSRSSKNSKRWTMRMTTRTLRRMTKNWRDRRSSTE